MFFRKKIFLPFVIKRVELFLCSRTTLSSIQKRLVRISIMTAKKPHLVDV